MRSISRLYHDSVNAILTPHQLELMKSMMGRLDNGKKTGTRFRVFCPGNSSIKSRPED
jgi:hypothetical protein